MKANIRMLRQHIKPFVLELDYSTTAIAQARAKTPATRLISNREPALGGMVGGAVG